MIARPPENAWTIRLDDDGIAWLTFDLPGSSVNTLGAESLAELDAKIDAIAEDASIQVVVILSGKPNGFIAGADISEFDSIRDEEQARALAKRGQDVFAKIASLKPTTVAVVHGACMGGPSSSRSVSCATGRTRRLMVIGWGLGRRMRQPG